MPFKPAHPARACRCDRWGPGHAPALGGPEGGLGTSGFDVKRQPQTCSPPAGALQVRGTRFPAGRPGVRPSLS